MLKKILGLFSILFVILLYGNRIEPFWLETTRHDIFIEKLPSTFVGERLAFISDFQIGMWLGNEAVLSKVAETIIKEKPLAVLIGGDFIYHPTDSDPGEAADEWSKDDRERTFKLIAQAVLHLKPIRDADIPIYVVLGNHDYSMGRKSAHMVEETARKLTKSLESIGIQVLHNASVLIEKNGEKLAIGGVAPHYPDFDKPLQVIRTIDSDVPRVLFMHNANSIKHLSHNQFSFAVAGHTHGGQIRVPFLPNWSWTSLVPHTPDEVMGDGWVSHPNLDEEARIYVNRGIGFSTLPLRFNCRPELSLFILKG